MKTLLLLSTLFLIPSQGYAADGPSPRKCDGKNGCTLIYLYPGRSAHCSNKATCIGLGSDLTCETGALCVNFGKQTPKCISSKNNQPTCKLIPLQAASCKWGPGSDLETKTFTCGVKDAGIPALPVIGH